MAAKLLGILKSLIGFVLIAALIVVPIYFFAQNESQVTLFLTDKLQVKQSLAVIVLAAFFIGASVMGLSTMFMKSWGGIQNWRFKKKHQKFVKNRDELVRGREMLAAGDFPSAKALFTKLVKADETDLLARSMLAETSFREGNFQEALDIVDSARQGQRSNIELLFLGSALNERVGNLTAAYDNIKLILKQQPKNQTALQKIVELAEPLGRLEEGIAFQERLLKPLSGGARQEAADHLAHLELKLALQEAEADGSPKPALLRRKVDAVLRRHRNYGPALARMAEIELHAEKFKPASKLYSRAFLSTGDSGYLNKAAEIWLSKDEPAKALEVYKKAIATSENTGRISRTGRVGLIRFLCTQEMISEAKEELEKLISKLPEEEVESSVELDLLKAELAERDGSGNEALLALRDAVTKAGLPAPGNGKVVGELPWHGSPVSIQETSNGKHTEDTPT